MSMHLVECVRRVPVQPSCKLALIAFADSADHDTQIALPGLEAVMEWASVGRSRAAELVAELVDLGLLKKHRSGHRGRRAEYIVFPRGCCALHPRPPEEGSDPSDPVSGEGSAPADPIGGQEKGSGTADSSHGNASGTADPIPGGTKGSGTPDASRRKASTKGPAQRTPSLTKGLTPQTPRQRGAEVTGCARPGPTPHDNCRGCGTTNRQRAAAADRAAQDRNRAAAAAQLAADRAEAARRAPDGDGHAFFQQTRKVGSR